MPGKNIIRISLVCDELLSAAFVWRYTYVVPDAELVPGMAWLCCGVDGTVADVLLVSPVDSQSRGDCVGTVATLRLADSSNCVRRKKILAHK